MQGQVRTEGAPATAADLPTPLLQDVFALLDHDSLFAALSVCKSWHAAGAAAGAQEALWQRQCAARGWAADAQSALRALGEQHRQQLQRLTRQREQLQDALLQQDLQQHEFLRLAFELSQEQQELLQAHALSLEFWQAQGHAGTDWRRRYRHAYGATCHECFGITRRRTAAAGSLCVLLCRDCSASFESPQPRHRLLAASTAKRQCCLKEEGEDICCGATVGLLCSLGSGLHQGMPSLDGRLASPAELAALPHCVEPNPVNLAFSPMHLYRRLDVRRAAVAKWGSWEGVQREYRRRLTRR